MGALAMRRRSRRFGACSLALFAVAWPRAAAAYVSPETLSLAFQFLLAGAAAIAVLAIAYRHEILRFFGVAGKKDGPAGAAPSEGERPGADGGSSS